MRYERMPIEIESPEQMGYGSITCNLTESSVTDATLAGLGLGELGAQLAELTLAYGDHVGHPGLRQVLADDSGAGAVTPGSVLVTPGAAGALFIISTALLAPGSHVIVAAPNYATNIVTPRAIGADLELLELRFEEGYRLDLERLAAMIRPDTAFVSLTCPHNPTGTMLTLEEIDAVIALVESRGTRLVLDETYRDMGRPEPLPIGAGRSPSVVSVSSMSKSYGIPGIRLGWLMTTDPALQELFLAAKEQMVIGNSLIDEEVAFQVLRRRDQLLPGIRAGIDAHREIVTRWMAGEDALEWVAPAGGVVCFPRITADAGVDVEAFYEILTRNHGTFVGPGHWFEQPRSHFRLGYGWPATAELEDGLAHISASLAAARA
ncbi:MAG TPA: pyridoxal phosphate-dependent aminotransferase [Acidimicrobiales bacterium]